MKRQKFASEVQLFGFVLSPQSLNFTKSNKAKCSYVFTQNCVQNIELVCWKKQLLAINNLQVSKDAHTQSLTRIYCVSVNHQLARDQDQEQDGTVLFFSDLWFPYLYVLYNVLSNPD